LNQATHILDSPIEYLKGIGPNKAEWLKKELDIHRFEDLLKHYPFRYMDRSRFHPISSLTEDGPDVQIKGYLVSVKEVGKARQKRLVARLDDGTGQLELVWFQATRWIKPMLVPGKEYVVFGKVRFYQREWTMSHPELEKMEDFKQSPMKGLQPVYSSTEKLNNKGLNSRGIGRLVRNLLTQIRSIEHETLNEALSREFGLIPWKEAISEIHFPTNEDHLSKARHRLKFEELFYLQLGLLRQKMVRQQKVKGLSFGSIGAHFMEFFDTHLPFELTGAQKRVVKEIRNDMGSGLQMNRLLQGDVGSGKTMVALMCMLIAVDNGYQSAMMAPTEILAQQHFRSLQDFLGDMDIRIAILTGSSKASERKPLLEALQNGEIDILVGTHALIEDQVQFRDLGFVVIDEQHRFGVAQRAKLWSKGNRPPHVLVMTATPIPRTLAMAVYGDLDISIIDELPPGRKDIKTVHRSDAARLGVFGFMKQEIAKGRQVYVVYPLIQESEKMDYKDLMDGYESICREFPLPDYRVSVVHGKMKPADKEHEMQLFVSGQTHIMVATTVIEVGVNVPNASVMVIESAERFGLSQLHQLRGRVGRGAEQSFCILMSGHKLSHEARFRLDTMVSTNDGFKIADADLKLRGPGDLMGTRQSGLIHLRLADISEDGPLMRSARHAAARLLERDPNLKDPQNKNIAATFSKMNSGKWSWSRIS
jgi:ATP-dependent DNA helicase RecG